MTTRLSEVNAESLAKRAEKVARDLLYIHSLLHPNSAAIHWLHISGQLSSTWTNKKQAKSGGKCQEILCTRDIK